MKIKEILVVMHDVFGYTDQDIAEQVDCSQPTIWRLRTGVTKNTFDHTAMNIRRFYAVSLIRSPTIK